MRPSAAVAAPSAYETARANIAGHGASRLAARRCGPIEVHCADVCDFELPDGNVVYYLFNPFQPPLLGQVFQRIRDSVQRAPRSILIAYCNPWAGTQLLDTFGFRKLRETQVIVPDWSWSLWAAPTARD